MRFSLLFTILLACSAIGQFIEWSFPAPCDNIAGLAAGMSTVYALDSLECKVYSVHYMTGAFQGVVQLPEMDNRPVGLALMGDTLYFAENGTAIVHAFTTAGQPAGVWDFSGSGIAGITGLDGSDWGGVPRLFFIGSPTSTIYRIDMPLGTNVPVEIMELENCPQVHDISAPRYGEMSYPVACNDPVSPVRMYSDPDEYEVLGYGVFAGAVGVAACIEHNRFYFSDPVLGVIHRYCMDMGAVGEGSNTPLGSSLTVTPNPSSGAVEVAFNITEAERLTVAIYDNAGRSVFTEHNDFEAGFSVIAVDGLPTGNYHLRLSGSCWSQSADFTLLR